MARTTLVNRNRWNFKPGEVLFKPMHIKSKDKLYTKYKNFKNNKKRLKITKKDSIKPKIVTKSVEKSNLCLQSNGVLTYSYDYKIVKINLKTMRMKDKQFPRYPQYWKGISICPIPNQKFFGIDFGNNLIFIVNKNLSISKRRNIEPKTYGSIIYLDGLIYLFSFMDDDIRVIETYDLNSQRWKKAVSMKEKSKNINSILTIFEGKVIIAPCIKKSVKAFDPFCNSLSKILKLETDCGAILLAANDKLYCIQFEGYVYESLPRDYTQWICMSTNIIPKWMNLLHECSLYNDSIYFVCGHSNYLLEFKLKTRTITFFDFIQ